MTEDRRPAAALQTLISLPSAKSPSRLTRRTQAPQLWLKDDRLRCLRRDERAQKSANLPAPEITPGNSDARTPAVAPKACLLPLRGGLDQLAVEIVRQDFDPLTQVLDQLGQLCVLVHELKQLGRFLRRD